MKVHQRGWTYTDFAAAFKRAAQQAAADTGKPELAEVEVGYRTFRRWMSGESKPRGRSSIILPYLFGVQASELFAPDTEHVLGDEIVLDPIARSAVVHWLSSASKQDLHRSRRFALASFTQWLDATYPGVGLLAATGAHLEEYCEAARVGRLSTGSGPRTAATVTRIRAVLLSFYRFAWRQGMVNQAPQEDAQASGEGDLRIAPLTRVERRHLRDGAAKLAAAGQLQEAFTVAFLEATGVEPTAMIEVTVDDLFVARPGQSRPTRITIRDPRGDLVAHPVPSEVQPWLWALSRSRASGDVLIGGDDGSPVSLRWIRCALIAAALEGGIQERRANQLNLNMLRTAEHQLLRHGKR